MHKNPHGIRPIVSGCSAPTEKISEFLHHHLKPQVTTMPSYIRDSGHLISTIESSHFPPNCLLVTIDVSALYLNIPQDEGTSECLRSLENRDLLPLPKNIMQTLFDIVLKCNVFSFQYQQIQGTAMGTKMAPSCANLFMDSLDSCFLKSEPLQPALWKRYIDDILCVQTVKWLLQSLFATTTALSLLSPQPSRCHFSIQAAKPAAGTPETSPGSFAGCRPTAALTPKLSGSRAPNRDIYNLLYQSEFKEADQRSKVSTKNKWI